MCFRISVRIKSYLYLKLILFNSSLPKKIPSRALVSLISEIARHHDSCDLQESIATCRFSQKVATVENYIRKNGYIDSTKEIVLLKNELELLKKQNDEVYKNKNENIIQ